MQMKCVLDFLAEDFLLSVLDIKIIDHGLFFNHLRPGASTGRPGRRLIDEKTQKEESQAGEKDANKQQHESKINNTRRQNG